MNGAAELTPGDLGVDHPGTRTDDFGVDRLGGLGADQPGGVGNLGGLPPGGDHAPRAVKDPVVEDPSCGPRDPAQEEARYQHQDPVFVDSDEEQDDLVEVSEKTSKFLHVKCTRDVPNETRKKVRKRYPLPKVPATRPPHLDTFPKQEVSTSTKAADKELASVQALVLDSMAPLTYLLEAEARGDSLTLEQVRDATKTAVELAGNANARISRLRREKVCQDLNKALIPLAKEDENFDEDPPSLFGVGT